MFMGLFFHTIDEKGRLAIPSKFREILLGKYEGKVVLSPDRLRVRVYPYAEWQRSVVGELEKLPDIDDFELEKKKMFYFAFAVEASIDKQGRILIPQHVRTMAGLDKEVTIVGINRRFEIWPRSAWENMAQELLDVYGDPRRKEKQGDMEA